MIGLALVGLVLTLTAVTAGALYRLGPTWAIHQAHRRYDQDIAAIEAATDLVLIEQPWVLPAADRESTP